MGYTHHWRCTVCMPLEAWISLCGSTTSLIAALGYKVTSFTDPQAGFIHINAGRYGVEHLHINRGPTTGSCKTLHTPSDTLVCAVLALAAQACPDFRITSDGDGWAAPLGWASEVLGREIPLPIGILAA